jgi:hypothetical protein
MLSGALRKSIRADDEISEFLRCWKGLPRRGSGDLPSRCDFDPGAVSHLLPRISIVEATQKGLRVRLVGTELVARLGRNPTRRYITEIAGGDYLRFLEELLTAVVESGRPMLSSTQYAVHSGRKATLHRLSVPFSTGGAEVDQVMTLTVFSWPIGAEPFPLYQDDRDGPHFHRLTAGDASWSAD